MFPKPEQFSEASRALFEAQMQAFQSLTEKAVESVQQLVELNTQAARASTEETLAALQQLGTAKDPQAFLTLSAQQARANAERVLGYSRDLTSIAKDLQSDLVKDNDQQLQDVQRNLNQMLDDLSKNAPQGSAPALEMLKKAIDQSNISYRQISKASEDAIANLQAQVAKVAEQFAQSLEQTQAAPAGGKKKK